MVTILQVMFIWGLRCFQTQHEFFRFKEVGVVAQGTVEVEPGVSFVWAVLFIALVGETPGCWSALRFLAWGGGGGYSLGPTAYSSIVDSTDETVLGNATTSSFAEPAGLVLRTFRKGAPWYTLIVRFSEDTHAEVGSTVVAGGRGASMFNELIILAH